MAAETEDEAHDRAKREFETLQMEDDETVSEYFARVNIILMKLERYSLTASAREIKRVVMNSLTPRFPNETSVLATRGDCDLAELELGLIRVERHRIRIKQERPVPRVGCCLRGKRPSGDHWDRRWNPWQRQKGQAVRRAPRRWSGSSSARTSTGHPQMHHQQQQHQHQPPAAMSQQSYAWQQQQQQHQPPAAM